MGKQKSIIEIIGTFGQFTFYKTEDGYLVKRKSSVSKNKIETSPQFERTRENMAEFGNAGESAKGLRQSILALITLAKDTKLQSRLVKKLMTVLQTDATNPRGQRIVANGALTILTGFDFNRHAELSAVLTAPNTTTIDRVAGTVTIAIPSFDPSLMLRAPEGTTHFKIVAAASEIDFVNKTFNTDSALTAALPWDNTATSPISQVLNLTAGGTLPMFGFVGVQFFESINGNYYPLKNNAYNPLGITKVDQV
jgi:hypothetical protein